MTVLLGFAFNLDPGCGDGKVYANKKQTEHDKRFDSYPKIKGIPKYKGGEKKLTEYILSKLTLSEVAKTQIFFLNYQFTVTCDGSIKDIKQIGDPKAADWTNITEILPGTEGSWKPAKNDGQPVDCVYFHRIFIQGSDHK